MKNESDLQKRFLQDARRFLAEMVRLLDALALGGKVEGTVNALFRAAHSLKSEASYVGSSPVTALSHHMESMLEQMRDGLRGVGPDEQGALRQLVDRIAEAVQAVPQYKVQPREGQEAVPAVDSQTAVDFTEFEMQVLEEAKARGEALYRVSCTIDPAAPMKFAKAYLIVNNLELISNVVRTVPAMTETEDASYGSLTVFLTTGIPEQEIRGALEVDQVASATIEGLEYEETRGSGPVAARTTRPLESGTGASVYKSPYQVGAEDLAQMHNLADEVKRGIARIVAALSKHPRVYGPVTRRLVHIASRAESLLVAVSRIGSADLSEEFARLRELAVDLGERLGKSVDLRADGGELSLDRRVVDEVSDMLIHLVRNAVDHGVENAEERRSAGKGATGRVAIGASRTDGGLSIVVRDDGRGVSREAVVATARKLGLPADSDMSLLSILSLPGFTTRQSSTSSSGRGVGLDLVVDRVRALGGSVSLESVVNKGTTVSLKLPADPSGVQLVVFRIDQLSYAMSKRYVREIRKGRSGELDTRICTLVVGDGDGSERRDYALLLGGSGKHCLLYVDELLFERDVQERSIVLGRQVNRHVYELTIGGSDPGFYFLHPSLIDSGD